MRKDINHPKVEDIVVAVVEEKDNLGQPEWSVYLINLRNEPLSNVIVASKGYGQKDGEKVQTSVLRHHWESIGAKAAVKVEPIMENLFGLSNEYWVSFYIGREIYDKKYVFLAESISQTNYSDIPIVGKRGVMIR